MSTPLANPWDRTVDPRKWGQREPVYRGDALIDLHDGKGTTWKRTPDGQYYPDCDCHRPEGIR